MKSLSLNVKYGLDSEDSNERFAKSIDGSLDSSNLYRGTPYYSLMTAVGDYHNLIQSKFNVFRQSSMGEKSVIDLDSPYFETNMQPLFSFLNECGADDVKDPEDVPIDLRTIGEIFALSILQSSNPTSARNKPKHAVSLINAELVNCSLLVVLPGFEETTHQLLNSSLKELSKTSKMQPSHHVTVNTICPATMSIEQALMLYPVMSPQERPNAKKAHPSHISLSVPSEKVESLSWIRHFRDQKHTRNQTDETRQITSKKKRCCKSCTCNGQLPPASSYVLSPFDMQQLGYPDESDLMTACGYVRIPSLPLPEIPCDAPLFAIDCEMCLINSKWQSKQTALVRVAIVDESYRIVYDTLVEPPGRAYDFRSRFSGITEQMLASVKNTLEDVQKDILKLIPNNAILVGHSLNFDLHALKMVYEHVIDTCHVLKKRSWTPMRLKHMMNALLDERIQINEKSHDPVEDAIGAMKLAQMKIQNGPNFYFSTNAGVSMENILHAHIFSLNSENDHGVIMDRVGRKQSLYKRMNGAVYHPVICDHELRLELQKQLASGVKNAVLFLRGMNELMDLKASEPSSVDESRVVNRVLKSVKVIEKLKQVLPPSSLMIVVAAFKINSVNAQKATVYMMIT